jgi:hypothetical protein
LTGNDITTIVAAVLALITAVVSVWNNNRIKTANGKIDTVHTLVNKQHDDLVNRTDQLSSALTAANVAVPDKPEGTS